MLKKLRLRRFKSWADTGEVSLKPITGLFGSNSSGKTSLLQALLLLKQTVNSSDRGLALDFGTEKTPVDLGDFQSLIFRHEEDSELCFDLDWERSEALPIADPKGGGEQLISSKDLGISTGIRGRKSAAGKALQLFVPEIEYRIGHVGFGLKSKQEKEGEYDLFVRDVDYQFVRTPGRVWPLPPPVKCYGFPDQVRAYYQNAGFLSDMELAFEDQLRQLYYLGPLRAYPERGYTWAGAQPSDMGRAGDQAVHALLSSRDRGEKISRGKGRPRVTLEEFVAEWLKKLGLIAEFRVNSVAEGSHRFQVQVRKSTDGPESLITDVGFGVSQILPVVVLCFYVPEGSTVILEQPEIHLHPAVQAGLADVLIDAWKKRRVQIIVESHSEHLLRRLQRRIAEASLSKDEVSLYFCQIGQGQSSLTTLDIDMFGNISNWPTDFFGDQFGEIEAMSKATLTRKKADGQ